MNQQLRPTNEQIDLIKKLDKLINKIWDSNATEEIISIAKKAIKFSKDVDPTTYILANGTKRINSKGKELITQVLINDIYKLENNEYSSLENEKFAVVCSIQLLIGVFAHLNTEELAKIVSE